MPPCSGTWRTSRTFLLTSGLSFPASAPISASRASSKNGRIHGVTPRGRGLFRARNAAKLARSVVDGALDLGLELDVASQEVVVLLAERLRVAALPGLRAPRIGQLVEAIDQQLALAERFDQR